MPDKEANGTLLRIENAILQNTIDIKDHIDKKIGELDEKHSKKIEDNRKKADTALQRITLLVVVLASTGVISGGVWGIIKVFFTGGVP